MLKRILFSNSKTKSVLLLLFLSLILGVLVFYTKIGIRPKAAPGVPTLSFSIGQGTLNTGGNFDLILNVNPNNATFYAFELYVSFDPTKVEFQNTANLSQNITSSYLLANAAVDTTNNLITVIGTRTGSPFSGSTNQEIARIKMKVKAGATGDIVYSWGATKLGSNITTEKVNGTFTIGGAVSGPVLSVDMPSVVNSTAQKGQNVDAQIFLNTNGDQVKATDVILFYDDIRLTFQNVVDLAQNIEINPNSGFNTQLVIKSVDAPTKKITIGLAAPTTPVQSTSDILLATIKFVVKLDAPDGMVDLIPDPASTVYNLQTQNILSCRGGYHLLVGQAPTLTPGGPTNTPTPPVGATNTPTPPVGATNTPTPSIGPTSIVLNIKLKFQGILGLPNQVQPLRVRILLNSVTSSVTQEAFTDFTVDNSGIWLGQVVFNGPPQASDYKVFIKGPKHLQKRICESVPQESFPGTYHCENGAINLNYGVNNLDFSAVFLLVGDLPQQDGVVNSYDISLVRNNVGSVDPSVLTLADLNLDGIVDSQDYSLIIAALSVRTDEGL